MRQKFNFLDALSWDTGCWDNAMTSEGHVHKIIMSFIGSARQHEERYLVLSPREDVIMTSEITLSGRLNSSERARKSESKKLYTHWRSLAGAIFVYIIPCFAHSGDVALDARASVALSVRSPLCHVAAEKRESGLSQFPEREQERAREAVFSLGCEKECSLLRESVFFKLRHGLSYGGKYANCCAVADSGLQPDRRVVPRRRQGTDLAEVTLVVVWYPPSPTRPGVCNLALPALSSTPGHCTEQDGVQRLEYSSHTCSNVVRFPATPLPRILTRWDRAMPLLGGFSRTSPVPPSPQALAFQRCSVLNSLHLHRLSTPLPPFLPEARLREQYGRHRHARLVSHRPYPQLVCSAAVLLLPMNRTRAVNVSLRLAEPNVTPTAPSCPSCERKRYSEHFAARAYIFLAVTFYPLTTIVNKYCNVSWWVAKQSGIFQGFINPSVCPCSSGLMHVFVLMEDILNIDNSANDKLSHICNYFLCSSYCSPCSSGLMHVFVLMEDILNIDYSANDKLSHMCNYFLCSSYCSPCSSGLMHVFVLMEDILNIDYSPNGKLSHICNYFLCSSYCSPYSSGLMHVFVLMEDILNIDYSANDKLSHICNYFLCSSYCSPCSSGLMHVFVLMEDILNIDYSPNGKLSHICNYFLCSSYCSPCSSGLMYVFVLMEDILNIDYSANDKLSHMCNYFLCSSYCSPCSSRLMHVFVLMEDILNIDFSANDKLSHMCNYFLCSSYCSPCSSGLMHVFVLMEDILNIDYSPNGKLSHICNYFLCSSYCSPCSSGLMHVFVLMEDILNIDYSPNGKLSHICNYFLCSSYCSPCSSGLMHVFVLMEDILNIDYSANDKLSHICNYFLCSSYCSPCSSGLMHVFVLMEDILNIDNSANDKLSHICNYFLCSSYCSPCSSGLMHVFVLMEDILNIDYSPNGKLSHICNYFLCSSYCSPCSSGLMHVFVLMEDILNIDYSANDKLSHICNYFLCSSYCSPCSRGLMNVFVLMEDILNIDYSPNGKLSHICNYFLCSSYCSPCSSGLMHVFVLMEDILNIDYSANDKLSHICNYFLCSSYCSPCSSGLMHVFVLMEDILNIDYSANDKLSHICNYFLCSSYCSPCSSGLMHVFVLMEDILNIDYSANDKLSHMCNYFLCSSYCSPCSSGLMHVFVLMEDILNIDYSPNGKLSHICNYFLCSSYCSPYSSGLMHVFVLMEDILNIDYSANDKLSHICNYFLCSSYCSPCSSGLMHVFVLMEDILNIDYSPNGKLSHICNYFLCSSYCSPCSSGLMYVFVLMEDILNIDYSANDKLSHMCNYFLCSSYCSPCSSRLMHVFVLMEDILNIDFSANDKLSHMCNYFLCSSYCSPCSSGLMHVFVLMEDILNIDYSPNGKLSHICNYFLCSSYCSPCSSGLMHVFVLMEDILNIDYSANDKLSHICNYFLCSSYCSRCSVVGSVQRCDGNTARLARRSDEALEERVSVARIAPPPFLTLNEQVRAHSSLEVQAPLRLRSQNTLGVSLCVEGEWARWLLPSGKIAENQIFGSKYASVDVEASPLWRAATAWVLYAVHRKAVHGKMSTFESPAQDSPPKKWGVVVLGTWPFVLREYVYVDALGRLGPPWKNTEPVPVLNTTVTPTANTTLPLSLSQIWNYFPSIIANLTGLVVSVPNREQLKTVGRWKQTLAQTKSDTVELLLFTAVEIFRKSLSLANHRKAQMNTREHRQLKCLLALVRGEDCLGLQTTLSHVLACWEGRPGLTHAHLACILYWTRAHACQVGTGGRCTHAGHAPRVSDVAYTLRYSITHYSLLLARAAALLFMSPYPLCLLPPFVMTFTHSRSQSSCTIRHFDGRSRRFSSRWSLLAVLAALLARRLSLNAARSPRLATRRTCTGSSEKNGTSHTNLGIVTGARAPSDICADPSSEMATVKQKAQCVLWFAEFKSAVTVQHNFICQYPGQRVPEWRAICWWVKSFHETGTVQSKHNHQDGQECPKKRWNSLGCLVCAAPKSQLPTAVWSLAFRIPAFMLKEKDTERRFDLTPLDFFFWGYVENIVYAVRTRDLEHLHQRITAEIETITPTRYAEAFHCDSSPVLRSHSKLGTLFPRSSGTGQKRDMREDACGAYLSSLFPSVIMSYTHALSPIAQPASRTLHCLILAVAVSPSTGLIAQKPASHPFSHSNSRTAGLEACCEIHSLALTISTVQHTPSCDERRVPSDRRRAAREVTSGREIYDCEYQAVKSAAGRLDYWTGCVSERHYKLWQQID
ncbi:hypothetical protein PR048_007512 [Dryococelus australis]|uniref:DUF4817 domain-containing protein n=1 Tax=Dryococelus australis TaxID=614101 RepID=A0ABQ9HUF3_9NEOP|nr:hypothetical protein PR048_007512 [Dryococelus australis]